MPTWYIYLDSEEIDLYLRGVYFGQHVQNSDMDTLQLISPKVFLI